jgi:hypothetical protein
MVEDALPITERILHDLAVASQFGNQDRNLGVALRGYYLDCDSGSQPRSQASFIFFVVFFSLPTRVSLAGAVDGGAEGAVGDASGEGNWEGPRARPRAGRPGVVS